MSWTPLDLPDDVDAAVEILARTSRQQPVLVFKYSPICPISAAAEQEFDRYLAARNAARPLAVARIDVLDRRALARGLAAALGIRHESPQALLLEDGELRWHDSHGALTRERFGQELDEAERQT